MTQSTPSSPVLTLSPELSQQLREHNEQVLLNIINTNGTSRYSLESPDMRDFHLTLATQPRREDSYTIDAFRTKVPLTDYLSYEPFISRFFEEPRKESELKDLLSPGLPRFIAISSSTSGKAPKFFPKYHPHAVSKAKVRAGRTCTVYSLCNLHDLLHITDSDGQIVRKIPVYPVSVGARRWLFGCLDVEKDQDIMNDPNATFPGATSPVAVHFISKYRPFLLMHALFALYHRNLEKIHVAFGTVFNDMIRYMVEEWDTLVHSIEHGKIPDYDGIEHVRGYLEPQMLPDPERAVELKAIGLGVDSPGWLKKIWPSLDFVITVVGGVYATVIPNIRHYIGPDVGIRSPGFAASEAVIGAVNGDSQNLFKATTVEIIEYLDFASGEDTHNVIPAWEVETGQKYEVVLTTRDGLWRYRLGDIIKIAGFDPKDGLPILEFVERKNVVMRLGHAQSTEKQLVDAIRSTTNETLGNLLEFTVVNDGRKVPSTHGYIVEIAGSPGPNAHLAIQQVLDSLISCNMNVQRSLSKGDLRPPTIRIVEPGTFREFRTRRMEDLNVGVGQIKIPVVLTNPKMEEWLLRKVVLEL